ncbi:MAG: amino acid adenylation domain-containing protein [Oscillatoriophycideae cyanobacterium NC_groundwater_1537_Pr4_S-0.65um_50_18]|nr:amino acid adenylation domain-containing protein [Oscillatoriophycideae cyanobacterium NC_groundwater_1537_Pr4_S-0.65um_50_18]
MTLERHLCTLSEDAIEDEVFVFPTSFAQQRLWFLDQLAPGTRFYNVPLTLHLTGAIDDAALTQSFNEIVRRHEALRTTFAWMDGQPVQVIAPCWDVSLPCVDLQSLPTLERKAELQQLLSDAMQRSFNLSQGPLLQLMLIRLSETESVLLLNFHHIVFDEWSSGVFIQELGALYTAFKQDQPSPLSDLPIQYADFAHWQREWLQGDVLERQLAYWRQQLNQVPVLDLPTDRPRPPVQSYRGTTQQLEIPQALMAALESLSQQAGGTLFMTLLAAFQTLLHRYTGQTDVAVGSPIANRNRSELEGLIGFFVNSLVLRTDLSGDPTFRNLLERVRSVALAAYAHQDVPFEKLVEELHPERHLSRNPLFQVVFALQNAPMQQLELPGLTLRSSNFETTTTRFDLELYLWECSDDFRSLWGDGWNHAAGLRGVMVYNTDLFDQTTILRLLDSFQILLEAIAINPDRRLSELPVLTASQEQQLLIEWNQTQRDYSADRSIHQLFEAQVEQSPDAIAVQFSDKSFTYRELNNGSNQLAHYLQTYLQTMGISAGARVGICMEQSVEMVAGLLGILKAGGAYVPLDPSYPIERLRWMIEDAEVSVLLTQHHRLESFSETEVKLICLDRDWETIAQASEANPTNQSSADDLAYVVYTSGSTGIPKGVAIPHRAVNRLVCNPNYMQWQVSDRVAQVSNISFDAATFEIWGALLNGAQLVGIDREVSLSPLAFAAQLQQQQISVLFLTTALFNQMAQDAPAAFSSLRYLLFGGEAVDPRWVQTVLKQGAPQHLLHMYGPTESTTFASGYEVRAIAEDDTTLPIGRPIANTQIYVLDPHLKPVPIGVRGELYIGGDGLAQGYLNRPELTAERFIPNPFQENGGSHSPSSPRLYKTGDLARYRADGNLEFLGRVDDQVKLRGFRIELGEIETVLSQHPTVQVAIVLLQAGAAVGQPDEQPKRLVAYLVSSCTSLPISDLRRFLKSKLPDYMVPAAFVMLDALPLTANGKVDRHALQLFAPTDASIMERAELSQTPQTTIEQTLATLWQQILGLERIGIHDNFFEMGGHSLLATQLMSRVRDAFQIEVPLRSLFETPTIAGLANTVEIMRWTSQMQSVEPIASKTVSREEVEI